MKQFKEGQIVKATQDAPYVTAGEIAEVKMSLISLDLILVFHEGIDDESAFPCKQANPEHFDFYEKIA
jgi:hypothetical protein